MLALLLAQVPDVRCTNCGADTWTKVAGIATLIGLAIAIAALVVSLKAANAADESLRITREQFGMAKQEHAAFLLRLGAHADLAVAFDPGEVADTAGYIRLKEPDGPAREADPSERRHERRGQDDLRARVHQRYAVRMDRPVRTRTRRKAVFDAIGTRQNGHPGRR